jgi:hypothetical protein
MLENDSMTALWEERIKWAQNGDRVLPDAWGCEKGGQRVIRCQGHHFVLYEYHQTGMRGFDGRTFRFRMLDTGEVIEHDNVWYQGTIPERYREQLPDNAESAVIDTRNAHP